MKKIVLTLLVLTAAITTTRAQVENTFPQISVSGEGTVKVTPDEAIITIGVVNIGKEADEVKKSNDETVDRVMKFLKKSKIDKKDYQTQRVYLNRNFNYKKQDYYYNATQTITIHLRDLSMYDELIVGLTNAGINQIQGVDFKSSKQEQYESEARVKAVADAKKKAEDYAGALGLTVGYARVVTDNTRSSYPSPMYAMEMKSMVMDGGSGQETLAVGEIEIKANVSITFELTGK